MRRATITAALTLLLMAACTSGDDDEADTSSEPPGGTGAVTAADVTSAVEAAGLSVIDPRDNTEGWCDPDNPEMVPCTEMLTTERFTVRVWATAADAKNWIDLGAADPPLQLGEVTTVDLHGGEGSVPNDDRAALKQALTPLTD